MSRALVTGAAGFVGRYLVSHLRELGDEVIETDMATDGLDLTDFEAVAGFLAQQGPEVVYHLAGWSDVGASWTRPDETYTANVHGTDSILRACAENGVQRVLVVTSSDIYGSVSPADLPITEDCPLRPASPYAASKAAAEMVAIQAGLGYDLDVIRARAFNHAGPGQRTDFVIPALADRLLACIESGNTELLVGSLAATRDFTDVRDVVRAYRLLIEHGQPGDAYNVCSGQETAISAILDQLIHLSGADVTATPDADLMRPADVPRRVGDPAKLKSTTGWSTTISLTETLQDVLAERRHARNTNQKDD